VVERKRNETGGKEADAKEVVEKWAPGKKGTDIQWEPT